MLAEAPGADACTNDTTKRFAVSEFADYYTSLGRPVAAGFIFGTAQQACTVDTCTPGLCSDPVFGRDDVNGAQAAGHRLYAAGRELQNRGVEVVMGSICQDFGTLLNDIAEVVKPPQTLTLPTRPAETAVTLLRIADSDGETRKICGRPLPPGSYADVRAAQDTGADWWFTATANPGVPVSLSDYAPDATVYVYINPKGDCRANPGETYSADYLGVVPEGGCVRTAVTDPEGRLDCFQKLGGTRPTGPTTGGAYTCFVPPGETIGTCTCGSGP
jgi:hypothetical protein